MRTAADTAAGGGQIAIRTARHPVNGAGGQPTVEVAVSDTGTGMSSEVARRATGASFTTKMPGRGTGLGLWMVQRVAAEAGDKVEIETAPDRGTSGRLTLPRSEAGQRV